MGTMKQLSRFRKSEREKVKAFRLSKELQKFYATTPVSPWQKEKIAEIRAMYEQKQKGLAIAHDIAASQLSEEFMQFELDYLYASQQFKEDNPGAEWHEKGVKGIFAKAFWKNLLSKAERMGIYGKKAEQN